MLAIEELEKRVKDRFPAAISHIDVPMKRETGFYWLDVLLDGRWATTMWKADDIKWGVSDLNRPDIGFGEGADEVYETMEAAFDGMVKVLTRGHVNPKQDPKNVYWRSRVP